MKIISTMVDRKLILSKLKKYKDYKSDADFARFLGISPSRLAKWYERNTFNNEIISSKFPEISISWLLTGEGPMLKETSGMNNITLTGKDHQVIGNILGGSSYILPEERPSEVGIELLQQKIDFLEKVIEEKDKMIAEKNKLIEEKERTISILLSNHKN